MTLADKIVVLRAGRIEQVGAPLHLFHDPDNRFVAGFIGSPAMNFVKGRVAAAGSVQADGLAATVPAAALLPAAGAEVTVGLRPQFLSLAPGDSHRVEITEALGGQTFIHVTAGTGEKLVLETREDPKVRPGDRTGIAFDPAQAMFFAADKDGRRLR
jgi:lactose/L-arabinose transport system ATP-binding protein